jgi:cytosine permease
MSTQSAPSSSQPIEPKSWEWGIAPHYIGLFLWIAFFDRLAPTTLAVGGLLPSVAGAAVGGLLAFLFLYLGPAWLGFRTKQSMPDLLASCFGEGGAKWLGGLIVGLGLVTMYALAIAYGVDWTLKGLVQCRLIDAEALRSASVGGTEIGSPLFLFTSTVWAIVSSLIALKFSRWIAALMVVFPVFPALLLGGIAAWEFTGLSAGIATVGSTIEPLGEINAFLSMIQLIVGFFALPSLISVEWGAAGKTARDVRLGGLVGVMLASMIVATLALLAMTGSIGGNPDSATLVVPAAVTPTIPKGFWRFESLLTRDVGGPAGGAMLMLFALGALAPAVYTAERIGRRFLVFRPKLKRWRWTMILTCLSLPLIWTILRIPVETLFGVVGAFLAPIAGVLAAEAIRPRPLPTPKRGFVLPAMLAWLVGLAVGLTPIVGAWMRNDRLQSIQPAALLAFLAACGIHALTRRSARPGAAVETPATVTP